MHMSLSRRRGALAAASGAGTPLEGHVCNARLRSLAPFALIMVTTSPNQGRAEAEKALHGALR